MVTLSFVQPLMPDETPSEKDSPRVSNGSQISGACRPCARRGTRGLPLSHQGHSQGAKGALRVLPCTEGHFQQGDARLPAE